MKRRIVVFESKGETLAGDLNLPDGDGPFPTMLFLMGTGSQNRYGDNYLTGTLVKSQTHRLLYDRLAKEGIASLCWDKRGVGESTGGDRSPGDPPGERDAHASDLTDVDDAESALNFLVQQPEIDPQRVAVWGWSAGVHFASLLAARTDLPAAYILVAGVYRSIPELVDYLFDWINPYLARVPEAETWIKEQAPYHYKYAKHWRGYIEAAERGEDVYELVEGDDVARFYLERTKQGIAHPPAEQFQNIQKPTLVLHGDRDVNVPVEDCYEMVRALNKAGNQDVALIVIPRADHGMRISPLDGSLEERRLARITPGSPIHPLSELFVQSFIGWLIDRLVTIQPERSTVR